MDTALYRPTASPGFLALAFPATTSVDTGERPDAELAAYLFARPANTLN